MGKIRKFTLVLSVIVVFSLVKSVFSEINYPWKEVYIGPLESNVLAGLVLVPNSESAFAFRLRIKKDQDIAEGIDLLYLISEVGPCSPDGYYGRLKVDLGLPFGKAKDTPILKKPSSKSDTLIFEWSRQDERTVIGRIQAPRYVQIDLIHYFPWDMAGELQYLSDGQVRGKSSTTRPYYYRLWTDRTGENIEETESDELAVSFFMNKKRSLYFVAGIDVDERVLNNHIYRYKNIKTIDTFLKEEENRYYKKRVKIDGLYKGAAQAVTNNMFWMTLYQQGFHRFYIPAGRKWIFPDPEGNLDHWTIIEWASFFSALEVMSESTMHAENVLRSVLETQYPNGNIPNWKGRFGGTPDRSQPPVGSYVVLKYFQRTGNIDFLNYAYVYLKKWNSFWKTRKSNGKIRRDGNRDGLLEWGADMSLIARNVPDWEKKASGKIRAMWESGQDDLPNWDNASFRTDTGTLNMNCLDLNSLYALDCWCLAEMAKILRKNSDYQRFLSEYEKIKSLVNTHLWDDQAGFYFDKYWDGRFSTKKAASNFYPLIAKIPSQEQALRMLKHLLDESEFWGEYVIPTISRDDPEFKKQQYWRGTIWAPNNYMVYQGLKAYGFDAAAAEFAKKSWELFLKSWENFQLCPENYDSRTGEAGGHRYQSWGPLLGLIAVEEYLDFTPWEGFRFGMINPEKNGSLSRIAIQDRHYDLRVSNSSIVLKEENREILKTDGGAVFRHFLYSENEVSFEIISLEPREIKLKFLTKGKYQLSVNGNIKDVFNGDSKKIEVSEDSNTVLILLLEKLD